MNKFFNSADAAYFNGSLPKFDTRSSTLVSASRYLNSVALRDMTAQEMLRRNGPDITPTAFIAEINALLLEMEDWPRVLELLEEEKVRMPAFRAWCEGRRLALFSRQDLEGGAPGTLRAMIHDFVVRTGYQLDFFFQGQEIENDADFLFRQRALTHDIEHMITGFGTDSAGEVALATAQTRAFYNYFTPEFAAFVDRLQNYLGAAKMTRSNFYYPNAAKAHNDALDRGAAQGRLWKYPLLLAPYHAMLDWRIGDIREELGIADVPPEGIWSWTVAAYEDPRIGDAARPTAGMTIRIDGS